MALPSHEPVDTALYILDSRGKLVSFTEQTDSRGVSDLLQILILSFDNPSPKVWD